MKDQNINKDENLEMQFNDAQKEGIQNAAYWILSDQAVILLEVSKQIPPGTIVDCRLRLRFSNCEDCYHKQSTDATKTNFSSDSHLEGYDFTDTDYNGPRPFKIIHLQIPITD